MKLKGSSEPCRIGFELSLLRVARIAERTLISNVAEGTAMFRTVVEEIETVEAATNGAPRYLVVGRKTIFGRSLVGAAGQARKSYLSN
jgi:hypothetical protein